MSNLQKCFPGSSLIGNHSSFIIPIFTIELFRMKEYRLDRGHFQMLTLQEADGDWNDHSKMDWKQRLRLMLYLNSIAYGYAGQEMPMMDRTAFQARMLVDG